MPHPRTYFLWGNLAFTLPRLVRLYLCPKHGLIEKFWSPADSQVSTILPGQTKDVTVGQETCQMLAVPVGRRWCVTWSDVSQAGRSSGPHLTTSGPTGECPVERVGCCLVLGVMLDRTTVFSGAWFSLQQQQPQQSRGGK